MIGLLTHFESLGMLAHVHSAHHHVPYQGDTPKMRLKTTTTDLRRASVSGSKYLRVPVHIYVLPLPKDHASHAVYALKAAAATGDIPTGLNAVERDAAGIGAAIHERGLHRNFNLDLIRAGRPDAPDDAALCVILADYRKWPVVYATRYSAYMCTPAALHATTVSATQGRGAVFPALVPHKARPWSPTPYRGVNTYIPKTSSRMYDATTPVSMYHDYTWYGVVGGYASPPADVPGAELVAYDDLMSVNGLDVHDDLDKHTTLHAHAVLHVHENGWFLPGAGLWKNAERHI